MSDIQRIPFATEQVTIPQTNITDAPIPARSPIAETIGQIAGVAAEFTQKYQEAQFDFDATEANLEMNRQIIDHQNFLRDNPIQPVVGENIVLTKQKNWQDFSDKLQKEYIDKLKNTELKMRLTDAWKAKSQAIQNDVVNNAIDENIAFMANRRQDQINENVSNGDFTDAKTAIDSGVLSGLLTRDQASDFHSFVDRSKLLSEMIDDKISFSDGKDKINSSSLPVDEKNKAQNIWQDREDERIRVEKEQLAATQDQKLEEGFLGISQNDITAMSQLDSMLEDGGRFEALDGPQGEKLRAALRRRQSDRDKGTARDDPRALNFIDSILMNPKADRRDVLGAMYDMTERGWLSSTSFTSYFNRLDTDAFRNKNETAYGILELGIKEMEKEGLLGESAQQIANTKRGIMESARNLQFGEHLTAREIATEVGFGEEEAVKLLNNLRDITIVKALGQGSLGETQGQSKWTNAEEFVNLGAQGQLFGKVFADQLGGFLADPTMSTEELKESLSRSYGGTFKDLSPINKSRVQTTMVAGDLIRKTEQLFVQEYNIDGIAGFEPETNLPTMTAVVGGKEAFYRLNIDVDKKEEVWEIFDDIDGWIKDDTQIVRDLKSRGELQVQFENLIGLPGEFKEFLFTSSEEALQAATELSESLREEEARAFLNNEAELRAFENTTNNSTSRFETGIQQ